VAYPVVLDTCVLYPAYLCDTLLRQAEAGTYRPLWSEAILSELRGTLVEAGLAPERVDRRVAATTRAFPDALVTGYEGLVPTLNNHPKDRHVLAAAIRGNAEAIVTFNMRDFPDYALKPYAIVAVRPDEFLLDQLELYPGMTIAALEQQAASYKREPRTLAGLLGRLERSGLSGFAARARVSAGSQQATSIEGHASSS
jgi:predicted nucleic acid-binding protein